MQIRAVLASFALSAALAVPASAQWLNFKTAGLPRTSDGKVDLNAAAPKTADGKPDLSGIWEPEGVKFIRNLAADLKTEDVVMTPMAQALCNDEILRRLGRPALSTDPGRVATKPDLLTALRSIPPKLAAAIVLRHYHGYNNREIAVALGVSERTIGTRLSQASARLRVLLEESPGSVFSLGGGAALSSEQDASSHAEH